ncbi:MAG: DUF1540 domain-containing protein [Chloroflexi bacterium]|nr:DUF1540 domain-containing protein [Chloroflexota bacterium]
MGITPVSTCNASICAYNQQNLCHTPGINVGPHAECHTYNYGNAKGGFPEMKGGIGACLASDCRFNQQLECKALHIDVVTHDSHADCRTYQPGK